MNGNDRYRTPKQRHHHQSKSSQRDKPRISDSGTRTAARSIPATNIVDLTEPQNRIRHPSQILGVKSGEGNHESPITFEDSDDEPTTNPKRQSLPQATPPQSKLESRSSPRGKTNTKLTRGPPSTNAAIEESRKQAESPRTKHVFANHARKSRPEPNPDLLLKLAKEVDTRKEHEKGSLEPNDDVDGVGFGPDDSPICPRDNRRDQRRPDKSTTVPQEPDADGRHESSTLKMIQSQAALMARGPQCTTCKEDGIVCDGQSPCAYCGDRFFCDNPFKPSLASQPGGTSASKVAMSSPLGTPQETSDVGDDVSNAGSEAGSVMPEVLFHVNFFEQRVLKFERELTNYQEYLVQRVLHQERTGAKRAPGPALRPQQSSPFAILKPTQPQTGEIFCLQFRDGPTGGALNKQVPTKAIDSSITTIVSDVKSLPRYRSIGRLGPLSLTRNVTIGKYNPYFPEDEALEEDFRASKYQEVRERYRSYEMFSDTINSQRECAELCALWHPFVVDLIRSLQLDMISFAAFFNLENSLVEVNFATVGVDDAAVAACVEARTNTCSKCDIITEPPWECQGQWEEVKQGLAIPARDYAMVGLLSYAFQKVTGLKLWHIVRGDASLRKSLKERTATDREAKTEEDSSTFCLVCGLMNCPSHGTFKQGKNTDKEIVLINDPEDALNIHKMIIRPKRVMTSKIGHVCGVFCVESSNDSGTTIRGLQEDGEIRGNFRDEMESSRSGFDAKVLCGSEACFWNVEDRKTSFEDSARPKSKADLTIDQQRAFLNCLELFLGNERGPCMAKVFIPGVTCMNVFFLMFNYMKATQHQFVPRPRPFLLTRESQKARKPKGRRKAKKDNRGVEDRPVFQPCNHDGPCHGNQSCTCFKNDVECEFTCGCDMTCDRRFQGCTCRAGPGQVCLESNCECWESSRECNPWLCGTCGVTEVLDQANKYREEIRSGRCRNSRLQLGLPARTIKAPSEVQGYGLFAGEDIPKNGFIGEYWGEVISRCESDRRGSTYHLSGFEYLFNLNQDQEIDATNLGNKTRFMNNSSDQQYINVSGLTLLCNGVQRVILSAKRNIKNGEELLYDYGYPAHIREKFWERGQESASKNAMTVAPGTKRATGKGRRGGGRKKKGLEDSEDDASPRKQNKKRKRRDDDPTIAKSADDAFDVDEPLPVIDGSEDSDYDQTADNSAAESEESLDGIPESSSGEEAGLSTTRGGSRRKGGPGDRRRGGDAQSRAWETRKKNMASGRR